MVRIPSIVKRPLQKFPDAYQQMRELRMRWFCYRNGLKDVDHRAYIAPGCAVHPSLKMEAFGLVNIECQIWPNVSIGAYSLLAPRCAIVGGDHPFDIAGSPIIFSGRSEIPRTVIGRDVWIGFGTYVIAGCRIGDGAIIGAGSVVTKDVPEFGIYAGTPAKEVGIRFSSDEEREIHRQKLLETPTAGDFCQTLAIKRMK